MRIFLMINCNLSVRHGDVLLKVLLELFQKLVGAAAIGGRPPQRAKLLIVRKRHRRVNFRRRRKEGNHTSGGFPFLHKSFLNCLPAFFFDTRGPNENWLRYAPPQITS